MNIADEMSTFMQCHTSPTPPPENVSGMVISKKSLDIMAHREAEWP